MPSSLRNIGTHSSEVDYALSHNFMVEVGGVLAAGFQEVSGLSKDIEVVEYRNGDSGNKVFYRPGKVRVGKITLRRGQSDDKTLHEWFRKVEMGQTDRRAVSIIQKDRESGELVRYNLFEAWPCAWKAPDLNAKSDAHLIEEITLVAESLEIG